MSDKIFSKWWECPQCNFVKVNKIINPTTGQIGSSITEGEQMEVCPNDGKNMVFKQREVSERELRLGELLRECSVKIFNLEQKLKILTECVQVYADCETEYELAAKALEEVDKIK